MAKCSGMSGVNAWVVEVGTGCWSLSAYVIKRPEFSTSRRRSICHRALLHAVDAPCNRPQLQPVAISPMLAPSTARALAPSSVVTLPSFLVPAFQNCAPAPAARRQFSASTSRPSKLGRTPISIPPGVELTIGEPYILKDFTTYKQTPRRTVTVTGPLGTSYGDWISLALRLHIYLRSRADIHGRTNRKARP